MPRGEIREAAETARAVREARVAGHFGEWLQGRQGPGGPLVLVTVPCSALAVTARRRPGAFGLAQGPELVPEARLRELLARLGLPVEGVFSLEADMAPGGGAGASTAALVALARAAGASEDGLAAACLAAEGASDPLMLAGADRLLWAPREGRVVERLPAPPEMEIVGGFLAVPEYTDPSDLRFPEVGDLLTAWRAAAAAGDVAGVATVASAAAERTSALRGPAEDPVPGLAAELGALGHLRAHTGSARGLIFAAGAAPEGAEAALRRAGLSGVLRFRTGGAGGGA